MSPIEKFSVSLRSDIIDQINARLKIAVPGEETRSSLINKCLERYFATLDYTRRELRERFSDEEIALILDVTNGIAFADVVSIQLLWHEIADGISMDALDKKWKIDGKELVEKMKALTYAENLTLIDGCERWWDRVASGEQPKYGEALKS